MTLTAFRNLKIDPPWRLAGPLLARRCALAGSAQAAAGSPRDSRIVAAADRAIAAGVPGLVIYTRRGTQTTLLARGYDRLDPKRAMTSRDRFRVGSVRKTFVATVVMQLVAERKLSLDDSIEQHLPGLVPNGGAITIRELLSHTSGLPDYFSNTRIYSPYLRGDFTYAWGHQESSGSRRAIRRSSLPEHLAAWPTRTPGTTSSA